MLHPTAACSAPRSSPRALHESCRSTLACARSSRCCASASVISKRWVRNGAFALAIGLGLFALVVSFFRAPVLAATESRENVHRPDVDCMRCHNVVAATLQSDPTAARSLLADDLEARCILCHGNEGPSHRTGIRPRKPVPDTLPLSGEGLIICATCHFMHGEQNATSAFVRIDNSRGGLCLTCHELSELEASGGG